MAEKSPTTVAILSPGDMGHSIGRALLLPSNDSRFRIITNLTGRSKRTQKLSESVGIIDVHTDEELVRQADFIFSILVPSEAAALAQRLSPLLSTHQHVIYVDMNAIAPQTVQTISTLFPQGNFVDACVIGLPPGSLEHMPTLYLSGTHAQKVADLFQYTDLIKTRIIGNEIGSASAFKMCYASLSKGITAITIQACVTAKSYELEQVFFDELKESMPDIFKKLSRAIPHMAPKAHRWVGEMEEIAKTYEDVGLSGKLFQGAAETYRFVAEETLLGKEIIEDRKRGESLDDALQILTESLRKKHQDS
ncbi:unnamed protein product [Adineta ricciae]|uniref:6-phosphogluconate dehydrogenase C-terminal domain-like protein n=1 Tax=Adineta ricciae TaxID=249248 RepID=A0A814AMK7_ADIRI|nr:unnamed protein product [Adineta ricciae]CAF0946470.1 unnamed protein product [Adineta ricciae]